jgi:hypothetical protein
MSTSASITQLRVPQTPTAEFPATTPIRFDAIMDTVTTAISSDAQFNDEDATPEADQLAKAYDALCAFVSDPVTNDHMLIREFAMALATMLSTDPLPLEESVRVANTINQLSMQRYLPSVMDWDARERQARHTASLMFALIQKRQRSDRLQQQNVGSNARH